MNAATRVVRRTAHYSVRGGLAHGRRAHRPGESLSGKSKPVLRSYRFVPGILGAGPYGNPGESILRVPGRVMIRGGSGAGGRLCPGGQLATASQTEGTRGGRTGVMPSNGVSGLRSVAARYLKPVLERMPRMTSTRWRGQAVRRRPVTGRGGSLLVLSRCLRGSAAA